MFPSSPFTGSGFFKHSAIPNSRPKKVVYYEDLYGERNEDEEVDRFPDSCESEIDSDEEIKKSSRSRAHQRFFESSYAGAEIPEQVSIATAKKKTPCPKKQYRIAPNKDSRRSIEKPSRKQGISDERTFWEGVEEPEDVDDSPAVALGHWRSSGKMSARNRLPRPVSRRLFTQQLAAQDKEKKEKNAVRAREEKREMAAARKKDKTAVRRAKMPTKPTKDPRAKLTEVLGRDNNLGIAAAYVLVDLTNGDLTEYERFP